MYSDILINNEFILTFYFTRRAKCAIILTERIMTRRKNMKKYLIPGILLILCAVLVLPACTMIKSPEVIKAEMEEKGYIVRLYGKNDTEKYKSMANLIKLESTEGVYNIIIADAGTTAADSKPLIIFFCDSKDATDRVFNAAKASLDEIVEFTNMSSPDDCNLVKLDNTVLIGDADMIELAKDKF